MSGPAEGAATRAWRAEDYSIDPYAAVITQVGDLRSPPRQELGASIAAPAATLLLPRARRRSTRQVLCQVDGCQRDLSSEKAYLQRYSVCEQHFKCDVALLHGQEVRFCQQCNKFEDLRKFEGSRRSCAARSKDRNMRRRLQTTILKGGSVTEQDLAAQHNAPSGSPVPSAQLGTGVSEDSGGNAGSGDASMGGSGAWRQQRSSGADAFDARAASAFRASAAHAPSSSAGMAPSRNDFQPSSSRVASGSLLLGMEGGFVSNRATGQRAMALADAGGGWDLRLDPAGGEAAGSMGPPAHAGGLGRRAGGGPGLFGDGARSSMLGTMDNFLPPSLSNTNAPPPHLSLLRGPEQHAPLQLGRPTSPMALNSSSLAARELDILLRGNARPPTASGADRAEEWGPAMGLLGAGDGGRAAAAPLLPRAWQSEGAGGPGVAAGHQRASLGLQPSLDTLHLKHEFHSAPTLGAPGGHGGDALLLLEQLQAEQADGGGARGGGGMRLDGAALRMASALPPREAAMAEQQRQQRDAQQLSSLLHGNAAWQDDLAMKVEERRAVLMRQQQQAAGLQTSQQDSRLRHELALLGSSGGVTLGLTPPEQHDLRLLARDAKGAHGGADAEAGATSARTHGLPADTRVRGARPTGRGEQGLALEQLGGMDMMEEYAFPAAGRGPSMRSSGEDGGGNPQASSRMAHDGRPLHLGSFGQQAASAGGGSSGDGGARFDGGYPAGSGGLPPSGSGRGAEAGGNGVRLLAGLLPGAAGREDALAARVCLKLFSCMPEELPVDLLQRMRRWATTAEADVMQVFMRPGCVHLVANLRHSGGQAALERSILGSGDLDRAVAALRDAFESSGLLRGRRVVVQAAQGPGGAFEYYGGHDTARWVTDADWERAPSVATVSPLAVACGVPCPAVLTGSNLLAPGTRFYARCGAQSYELCTIADNPGAGLSSAAVAPASAPATTTPMVSGDASAAPDSPLPSGRRASVSSSSSAGGSTVAYSAYAPDYPTSQMSVEDSPEVYSADRPDPLPTEPATEHARAHPISRAQLPSQQVDTPVPVLAEAAQASHGDPSLATDRVAVMLPPLPHHGLVCIEAVAPGVDVMGSWAVAVACHDPAAVRELNAWALERACPASVRWLLLELGVLLEYDTAVSALLEPVVGVDAPYAPEWPSGGAAPAYAPEWPLERFAVGQDIDGPDSGRPASTQASWASSDQASTGAPIHRVLMDPRAGEAFPMTGAQPTDFLRSHTDDTMKVSDAEESRAYTSFGGRLLTHPLLSDACEQAMHNAAVRLLAFATASGLVHLASGLLAWLAPLHHEQQPAARASSHADADAAAFDHVQQQVRALVQGGLGLFHLALVSGCRDMVLEVLDWADMYGKECCMRIGAEGEDTVTLHLAAALNYGGEAARLFLPSGAEAPADAWLSAPAWAGRLPEETDCSHLMQLSAVREEPATHEPGVATRGAMGINIGNVGGLQFTVQRHIKVEALALALVVVMLGILLAFGQRFLAWSLV